MIELTRQAIESESVLLSELKPAKIGRRNAKDELVVAVVDQYEEKVAQQSALPSQFVERLSLLDRGALRTIPVLFLWLTTSREFQEDLATATSRNERILVRKDFELVGPQPDEWAEIVEDTFAFHNQNQPLADFEVLRGDIEQVVDASATIGQTIENVGIRLSRFTSSLHDLSQYQVIMLWPVTDGLRITRVTGFTNARDGYRIDWNAFYRELSEDDKANRDTLAAYNRARLYFDMRLVPIAAADLSPLCQNLDNDDPTLSKSYLDRFQRTHLVSLISESWDPRNYSPLKERESKRAALAREWYAGVTTNPVGLGKRLSLILSALGWSSTHEGRINSKYRNVRTDVLVERPESQQSKVLVELKAFSTDGTRPSSIRDAVRGTLRKYAQFAGFIEGD
ncbi:hypothetical protein [Actinoplanes sp. NPDC049118]|uniref:hypothetical protein n=1 Tax=Actinoplanes sp. NPDC049118 TaxID=3155769 RepID=UPI0033DE3140